MSAPGPALPDGVLAVVKRSCPTCTLVAPVLAELARAGVALTVWTQDDPAFPAGVPGVVDDGALELSWRLGVTTVPTLVRVEEGREMERLEGWDRQAWERLTGVEALGDGLPGFRPGCGSRTVEPGVAEGLEARFLEVRLRSRRVELGGLEDEAEALFARGWSDGLPVVAPTEARVLRMLRGTTRSPDEVVAVVPPDQVPCTVEKVAVNAVLAGCLPEHLPVVLAAVEAACTDEFNMHGLLATTYFSGPVVVVNGPVTRAIAMNSGLNALGQGNRANATIGRALQLVVRNVGGGRPGEVDRATLGNPGKYTFCFAEDEAGSPWEPLSVERGFAPGASTVTLFAGGGVQGLVDQLSRTPESLARSLALGLRAVAHTKLVLAFDALLVVSPEHARVFREAGWDKARLRSELDGLLSLPGQELARGAGGVAEGVPQGLAASRLPKFRPGGLLMVHAGGTAGLFSAIIGGWVGGATGSEPVTREVRS
ncbi:MAG TPA: thioredoxin family protein [Acidimicrobiales bacterium]|nr:thioredoxin family protein [Acidimicrobiales bacterium]